MKNQSPKASAVLFDRAINAGIDAQILDHSKPGHRRYHPSGGTWSPQKVLVLNGIRMSIGQAREYIEAREC